MKFFDLVNIENPRTNRFRKFLLRPTGRSGPEPAKAVEIWAEQNHNRRKMKSSTIIGLDSLDQDQQEMTSRTESTGKFCDSQTNWSELFVIWISDQFQIKKTYFEKQKCLFFEKLNFSKC